MIQNYLNDSEFPLKKDLQTKDVVFYRYDDVVVVFDVNTEYLLADGYRAEQWYTDIGLEETDSVVWASDEAKYNIDEIRKEHGLDTVYGIMDESKKCWKGYRRVKGKKSGEKGSCEKINEKELNILIKKNINEMVNDDLNSKIRDWYISEFPTDDLGNQINYKLTFNTLLKDLPNVYEHLGIADSIIRERVFDKLAKLVNKDYDYIYKKWLS